MSIAVHHNAGHLAAASLRAFFETSPGTDAGWDMFAGWPAGRCRELLDERATPTREELLEICIRAVDAPSRYFFCPIIDTPPRRPVGEPFDCTDVTPCCPHRDEFDGARVGQRKFACPRHCPCHD